MILGAHFLLYSKNADADRVFFRDVLGFPAVDVGHGWLILGMRAAELGVHPVEGESQAPADGSLLRGELYLICDDVRETIASLGAKNVHCSSVTEEPWGFRTTITLPSGGEIGLYQPLHPTALDLK